MTQTDARLAELLGSAPPPGVAQLADPDKRKLVDLIETALAAQDRAIGESLSKSVKQVPLPLRPLAKRVLLG